MGGLFSRNKGAREERLLVQQLNDLGYLDVKRVPLSGAAKGFKFDVLATDPETKEQLSFELKTKNSGFKWVYEFLDKTGFWRVSYQGKMLGIGKTPKEASLTGFDYKFVSIGAEDKKVVRIVNRLFKLADLKKDADFLTIRINNKHRIFLKFWL